MTDLTPYLYVADGPRRAGNGLLLPSQPPPDPEPEPDTSVFGDAYADTY